MGKLSIIHNMGRADGTYTMGLIFNGLKPVATILVEPTAL